MENLRQQMRLDWKHVPVFEGERREFDAHGDTNLSLFSADEIKQIDAMIRFVCDQGAAEVSEFSHTIVWEAADMGEDLPYSTFLVSYLHEPDDARLQKAASHLAEVEKQDGRISITARNRGARDNNLTRLPRLIRDFKKFEMV